MAIYFTFKKGTHISLAFKRLQQIFKTAELKKEGNKPAEIGVGLQDFDQNKKDFPDDLAIKVSRVRSGPMTLLEHIAFGVWPFDNQNCQEVIGAITK